MTPVTPPRENALGGRDNRGRNELDIDKAMLPTDKVQKPIALRLGEPPCERRITLQEQCKTYHLDSSLRRDKNVTSVQGPSELSGWGTLPALAVFLCSVLFEWRRPNENHQPEVVVDIGGAVALGARRFRNHVACKPQTAT